ncbi:MAG: PD-(D/E)XK nuclease family protein [Bacilli bacterium]
MKDLSNHFVLPSLEQVDFVIAPKTYHNWYLKHKKGQWQLSFQLLTKETFLRDLTFDLDEDRVIPQLVQAFNLTIQEVAQALKLLQQIKEDQYPIVDARFQLQEIWQYLIKHQLILRNPLVNKKYQGKRFFIDGYLEEDRQLNTAIHGLQIHATYQKKLPFPKTLHILEYASIEDEVSAMYNRMSALSEQGTDLKDMFVLQPNDDYLYELERQSVYFQIPIQLPLRHTLFSLPITQKFLHLLRKGTKLDAIWETLESESSEDTQLLKSQLASIPLAVLPLQQQIRFVEHIVQQRYIQTPIYQSAVKIVKDLIPSSQQHVFVLGFLQGQYPSSLKDQNMFDEKTLLKLGLMTTQEKQQERDLQLTNLLARTQHLYLSYPRLIEGKVTIPSPLIQIHQLKVEQGDFLIENVDYSGRLGVIRKEKYAFVEKQFHQTHPTLSAYRQQYPEEIKRFDYAFKGLEEDFTNKALKLSYSALKDYYQCSFKYFVGRILKVNPMDQDEFYMHLGTFAHEVFETMKDDLNQFDVIFAAALANQKRLSAKELILFENLKPQLRKVCEFNLLHQRHMQVANIEVEKEMTYQHDENTSLVGYIDKIILLRTPEGKEYVSVVDYKSGAESFDEDLIEFGWSLQLPIYALMLENHPDYQNKDVLGLFIQHIIETSLNAKTIEIGDQTYPKSYQLDGIILNEKEKIQIMDDTILDGKTQFIQGVSVVKKGGFRKSNHLKSANEIAQYASKAKDKITEASRAIRQGDFAINPKNIKKKSSCDYCPFLDTCFRKPHDVQVMHIEKKLNGEATDGETD